MIKYLIAFICLLPKNLLGQDKQTDTMRLYNASKSIEYINQYINLRFTQNSDIQNLDVITDVNKIQLSPNTSTTSWLYFNYKFIVFRFGFVLKFLPGNHDNDIKGTTTGTDYGLNLNFNHWLQDIYYSKTKGYYLKNTSEYDPNWTSGDPYVQFPQLVYQNFQGITAYKFNDNFSVNAVTSQSERQLKSAGSFIPHLLYSYYTVDDKATPPPGGSKQKSKNFEILLGAGYYYTFVVKNNFYFSLGLTPEAGFVFTKLTTSTPTGNIITNQQNGVLSLDGRAGLGYNGQRFFTGIYMKASAESYKQGKASVINQDSKLSFQMFFGYRLKAPRWLSDNVKHVSDKVVKP